MITKKQNVVVVLDEKERQILERAYNILDIYLVDCDENDYDQLTEQMREWGGDGCDIDNARDALWYLITRSVIG